MKTKLILLFSLIILFNCTKEDYENTISPNEITLSTENTSISTYQITNINVNNTNLNDSYEATIAGETITLTKTDDTILSFLTPSIPDGNYSLDFELGTLDFEVTQTSLTQTSDETIESFKTAIETNFTQTTTQPKSKGAEILENIIDNTSDDEQQAIALYLEANKEAFNTIINLPTTAGKNLNNDSLIRKVGNYNVNVFQIGIGGLAVYGAAGLGSTGIGAILAGTGLALIYDAIQDTVDNADDMINTSLKVVDYNYFEDSLKANKLNNFNILSFSNNTAKIINANQNKRTLNESDRVSDAYFFDTFFTTYDTFDTIISKMNNVINLANKVPFVNIPNLENNSIPTNSNATTNNITVDDFNNYTFSVTNNNIDVNASFKQEGSIELTLIANNSLDVSEDIETQLIITYKDDFNELSKEIDIILNKEEIINPFIGTWKAVTFGGTPVGEFISINSSSNCPSEFYTVYSATAVITENKVNITVTDQFKNVSYIQQSCTIESSSVDTPFAALVINDYYVYNNENTITVLGVFDQTTSSYPLSIIDGNLRLRDNYLIVFEKQ